MKITNRLNLPDVFYNILNKDMKAPVENRYSVTELLKSTREIKLTRKYFNEIEVDASDSINTLFGSSVHLMLEQNNTKGEAEYKLEYQYNKFTIVGVIDLLERDTLTICDYKTCSVSKITKQDFNDWRMQGLLYAWLLFKKENIIIRRLKFYALMKDWSKIKAAAGGYYPNSAIYTYEYNIEDSDYDYIEKWLNNKLSELDNDIIPQCSDEEKWFTGDKYAVYKNVGDKRAAAVLDTEEEAHNYITNKCNGTGQIEVRKGECLKCKYYCNCNKFCNKEV